MLQGQACHSSVIKSALFTPATNVKAMAEALGSQASMIILDLEDAVALKDKGTARKNLVDVLQNISKNSPSIGVRINSMSTVDGINDIKMLEEHKFKLDYLLVPKIQSGPELNMLDKLMDQMKLYDTRID